MNNAEKMMLARQARSTNSHRKVKIVRKMTENQTDLLKQVSRHSPRLVSVYKRAFSGGSKAAAIKGKCIDCVGYGIARVRDCECDDCPLWPYRPFQRKETHITEVSGGGPLTPTATRADTRRPLDCPEQVTTTRPA